MEVFSFIRYVALWTTASTHAQLNPVFEKIAPVVEMSLGFVQ